MEALRKGLGKRRTPKVKCGSCVTLCAPPSISAFDDPTFEFREEEDFVFVEAEDESVVRKLLFEIQSLRDDKDALKRQVKEHLHRELEMQYRIEHLEKQGSTNQYWYHKMQVRADETEAELAYMKQDWSRLESEKSALQIQVEAQKKAFEHTVKCQAYKISLLEADSQVLTQQIQQLEEVKKVSDVLQGLVLTHSEKATPPLDVTLPVDANRLPVSTETLVEYIPEMSPKWEFIGHKLGLAHKVNTLRISDQPAESKCLAMLSEWVQSGREVTWQHLLKVLTNSGILLYAVAAKIKQHLMDQAS